MLYLDLYTVSIQSDNKRLIILEFSFKFIIRMGDYGISIRILVIYVDNDIILVNKMFLDWKMLIILIFPGNKICT